MAHIALEEAEVFPQCLAIESENRGHQTAKRRDIDVTSVIRAMRIGHDDAEDEFAEVLEHSSRSMQEVADMDLDLLRLQCNQLIEPHRKAGDILARQADDQIRMDMHTGFMPEKSKTGVSPG